MKRVGPATFWGVVFIVLAGGCAVLPMPLARILIAVVVVSAIVAWITHWLEQCRPVISSQETQDHLDWYAEIEEMRVEEEQAWEEFSLHAPPDLRSLRREVRPNRLRKITRFPQQRTPGALS